MNLDMVQLIQFLLDFFYTILIVFVIARYLYFRRNGKKAFYFTYVIVSAIIFQLCIILVRVPLELGFAIGLFAIFGIIRYRTSPINPREMTYLLVCAGIAAKNALMIDHSVYIKILISDLLLLGLITFMEIFVFKKGLMVKIIMYNKLDMIHEDVRPQLISDLQTSFGIRNVEKIQVGKIDTLKKSAQLKVYFLDTGGLNFNEED